MKIFLNIEAESPQEMSAVLQGLAGIGAPQVSGPGELQVASVAAAAAESAADEPKKTRGRPKADVKTPAPEPEPAAPSEPVEAQPDVKPITFDEVKNSVIDLLNDWTEAMPKDGGPEATTVVDGRTIKVAEIRTTILADMLPKLGASRKISTIPEENFSKVQALIDESREKLAEYVAQREVEE